MDMDYVVNLNHFGPLPIYLFITPFKPIIMKECTNNQK
jgi:hypothetical protein